MTSETSEDQPQPEADRSVPSAGELLRGALVDDQDPRFPWWLPLPGLAVALSWAAFRAATAGTPSALDEASGVRVLLETLLWPGAGIFVLATLATFFGWQLDID